MDISIETLVEKGVGAISIAKILNIPLKDAQRVVGEAKLKNTKSALRKKCGEIIMLLTKCDELTAGRVFETVAEEIAAKPSAIGLKRGRL